MNIANEMEEGYDKALALLNALLMDGEAWGFPEFVHGQKLTPGGTRHQGWSAAAAIIGHHAVHGKSVFRINDEEVCND